MSIFEGKAPPRSEGGGDRPPPPPAGNHHACLVAIVDLGTHRETYPGREPEDRHKVYLCWELVDEQAPGGGDNFLIARDFYLSYHEKAGLRLMLEGWGGKPYAEGEPIDLGAVLGKKCLLNVQHKESKAGNTYASIKEVTPLPKNSRVSDPQREPFQWEIGPNADLDELPAWLPWLYGKDVPAWVKASPEWGARTGGSQPREEEIPEGEEVAF
jgi:hypothetical protein